MKGRRAAARQTRDRILTAAVTLHARQGIAATSWDDLAVVAGVNRATVYRHFPDLESLIPDCARRSFEAIDLPTVAEIRSQFADLGDVNARLERLVRLSCQCFERGASWLRAAYREADMLAALSNVRRRIQADIALLLDVVLDTQTVSPATLATMRVLLDFPLWQQLMDAGVPKEQAPLVITAIVSDLLAGDQLHNQGRRD